jgi:hypothetical protein
VLLSTRYSRHIALATTARTFKGRPTLNNELLCLRQMGASRLVLCTVE